jgi:hypothetical protein
MSIKRIEIKSWVDGSPLHTVEAGNIKQALEILSKNRASLVKADLLKADLAGANLAQTDLSYANLSWANLRGADLSGAILVSAKLINAGLSKADLSGANLLGANLAGANLVSANLTKARLLSTNLCEAALVGANLTNADLSGAILARANLFEANFGQKNLTCLSSLDDAISLAPLIFNQWEKEGFEKAIARFGLWKVPGEERGLISMAPDFSGGFCYVLRRREIWWWDWTCPDSRVVPVLWREGTKEVLC